MRKILGLRSHIDLALLVLIVAGFVYTIGFGTCLPQIRNRPHKMTQRSKR